MKRFRDEADGSGAPWLFGIARNLLRQYHKHNRIETAARNRLGLPLAFADCEDYDRVDERIAATALGPALHVAVQELPVPQRRALELRVVQQLSYDEVAGQLGCSQNAARLRVSRALRTLTLALGGAEGTARSAAILGCPTTSPVSASISRLRRRGRCAAAPADRRS